MKVKAKVSFTGTVNMAAGEEREFKEGAMVQDLIKCGYVEVVQEALPPQNTNSNDSDADDKQDKSEAEQNEEQDESEQESNEEVSEEKAETLKKRRGKKNED